MGTLSDFAVGAGTSVATSATLPNIPTQSLRLGDLAFCATAIQVSQALLRYWAFVPGSTTALATDVVLADIARGSAVNPGRWHLIDIAPLTAI